MSALIPEALAFASTPGPIGTGEAALLSVLFGALVGLSLGLTGGGGSIFAVPLLVYGLAVPPREVIGVSLAAVGATALVGSLRRPARGEQRLFASAMIAVGAFVVVKTLI